MPSFFDPPATQVQKTQQVTQARSVGTQAGQNDNEALAKRLSAIQQGASWLKPDAAFSLARAGVTPGDKDFAQIAKAAGNARVKERGGWAKFGDLVKTPFSLAFKGSKGTLRALDVIGRSGGEFVDSRARDVSQGRYMDAFTKSSLALPSVIANTGEAAASGIASKISGRPARDLTNSPADLLNKVTGGSVLDGTLAGAVTDQWKAGERVELGKGYFAPEADEKKGTGEFTAPVTSSTLNRQITAARSQAPLIGNQTPTLGRMVASKFVEPGTYAYNLLSGGIDMTKAFVADPTNVIGPAGKGNAAKGVFNTAKGVAFKIDDEAGLVKATRQEVVAARADQFLTGDRGQQVLKTFGDSDFPTLYKQFGGQVPVKDLVRLADTKNAQEASDILRPMLGITVNKLDAPSVTGRTVNNLSNVLFKKDANALRFSQLMPNERVNLDDVDDTVDQAHRIAVNAKLPEKIRLQRMEEMARQTGRNGRLNVLMKLSEDITDHLSSSVADAEGNLWKGDLDELGNPTKDSRLRNEVLDLGQKVNVDGEIGKIVAKGDNDVTVQVSRRNLNDPRKPDIVEHTLPVQGLRVLVGDTERETARKLTRMFHGDNDKDRKYWVDASSGLNMKVEGAILNGENNVLPTPHYFSEMIGQYASMPDARSIRDETTRMGRWMNGGAIKYTKDGVAKEIPASSMIGKTLGHGQTLADAAVNSVWKKLVLLRAAYAVRVVGEEQLRMAGAGYDSMFNNPLSYISMVVGGKFGNDIMGQGWKDEAAASEGMTKYAESLSRGVDYRSGGTTISSEDKVFSLADIDKRDDYIKAWASQLLRANGDEATRRALGGKDGLENVDTTKEWFFNGEGRSIREEIAAAPRREGFLNRDVADSHIDSLIERAKQATYEDPKLLEAIRTGKLELNSAAGLGEASIRNHLTPSKDLLDYLRREADEGRGPSFVAGQVSSVAKKDKAMEVTNRVVDRLFYELASRPTNELSRSPVFKQEYWGKVEELLPFMDQKAQQRVYGEARNAKVTKDTLKRMREVVDSKDVGDLALNEVDDLSKMHALMHTRNLLFDVTRRNQFFDAQRLVFAFGDAWKEVMTTWAKLTKDNPVIPRRGQQLIEGARSLDPDEDGQGFFYKDPTTNEETFAYPGSRYVTQALLGVPVPLTAPVKGLNIFGSILPGVGPVAQFAAGALIPDTPGADWLNQLAFPFGEPNREGGIVESNLPPWAKKLHQALSDGNLNERQYNNTYMNLVGQLLDSDEYNANDPADVQRAQMDARWRTRALYAIQSAAAFAAPASPQQSWMAEDQDGRMVNLGLLKDDLNKMYEADKKNGTNIATQTFLRKYGPDIAYLVTPRSEAVAGFVPVTKAGKDWAREHAKLAEAHPDVYGLFAPSDGKFDIDEWGRQYKNGERVDLTEKEVLARSQQMVGNAMYRAAKSQVEGRTDKAAKEYLKQVREQIGKQYPGYNELSLAPNEVVGKIDKLDRATTDPKVGKYFAATDAGQGLAIYLEARRRAQQSVGANKSYTQSKDTQYVRDWLNQAGENIAKQHPDFKNMWDQVLSREVSKDTTSED